MTLSLTNVKLGNLLDLVAEQTGTRYSVEEYAVAFRTRGNDDLSLITRTFNVPPDFLKTAVSADDEVDDDPFADPGTSSDASGLATRMNVRDFLQANGVTFPDGSVVFYNPAASSIVVKNTATNVGLIEDIVNQAKSAVPRQVVVELKMVQTTVDALNELGMDTLIGGFNVDKGARLFAGGGTVGNQFSGAQGYGADFPFVSPANTTDIPQAIGENPLTAGLRSANSLQQKVTIDSLLEGAALGANQKSPAVIGVSGVFTDPQFQTVLRALSQKKEVDIGVSPSVVVRSGERASILTIREFIYPLNSTPNPGTLAAPNSCGISGGSNSVG